MYNPLNEEFMFQEMRDRTEQLRGLAVASERGQQRHRQPGRRHPERRWWQRASQRTAHRAE